MDRTTETKWNHTDAPIIFLFLSLDRLSNSFPKERVRNSVVMVVEFLSGAGEIQ